MLEPAGAFHRSIRIPDHRRVAPLERLQSSSTF
jgi:hypothetical protein